MHILNFGTQLQPGGQIQVRPGNFFSQDTILDADLIFLNIQSIYSNMYGNPSQQNIITTKQKETYEKGIKLRKKEFEEYFTIGRTLIITSPVFHEYQFQIKEDSGKSGILDIWSCLEIKAPTCSNNNGQNIETIDEPFAQDFLHPFKPILYYNKRIDDSIGNPLFYIKDTKYVVGEYYKIRNGLVLILPEFRQPQGNQIELFIGLLNNLSKGLLNLNHNEDVEFPEMIDKYKTKAEFTEITKLNDLVDRKVQLEKKIENQSSVVESFKWIKLLFAGDGNLLEKACEIVFNDLGFEVIKPEGNRDDLIIKINEKVGVVEIKGVAKSSAEKHAAQLQKWVTDYHITNDINPKGILVLC